MRRALLSLLAAIAVLAVLVPVTGFAAGEPEAADVGFPYYGGLGGGKPLVSCTGFFKFDGHAVVTDDALGGLPPCQSVCDIIVTLNRIIVMMLSVLVTVIAPVFLFVGGFLIFTGGGNPGQRSKGMAMMRGTLIGLLITVCSFLIVNQLLNVVFGNAYGDVLKQRLREQVADGTVVGIKESDIDNLFDWNSISCTVTASGFRIDLTKASSTGAVCILEGGCGPASPSIPTTGIKPPATGQCVSPETNGFASCTPAADKAKYQCITGWQEGKCPSAGLCCVRKEGPTLCAGSCADNKQQWSGLMTADGKCLCK